MAIYDAIYDLTTLRFEYDLKYANCMTVLTRLTRLSRLIMKGAFNGSGAYRRFQSGCVGTAEFLRHPRSARWASYALKPAVPAAYTPCWQTCCFECSNDLRCAQWAWETSNRNHSQGECFLWARISNRGLEATGHVVGVFV